MIIDGFKAIVGESTDTVVALVARFKRQRGTPGTAHIARNTPLRRETIPPGDKYDFVSSNVPKLPETVAESDQEHVV